MRHYNSKIMADIIMCLTAVTFIITSCGDDLNDTEEMLVGTWKSTNETYYHLLKGDTIKVEPLKPETSFSLLEDHSTESTGAGKWYADKSNLSVSYSGKDKLFCIQELSNVKLVIYEDYDYENQDGQMVTRRHILRMVKN